MHSLLLRGNLVELLRGGQAHISVEKAISGLQAKVRGVQPAPGIRSVYEELEHMRLAQEDILRYTVDPAWESPPWPVGYWPPDGKVPTHEMWEETVGGFLRDLEELIALVESPSLDLTAEIPHGEGRTYVREIILAADHNAYHLGKIVQTRKLLGDWPPKA
jgi:hypothetical protein